MELGTHYVLQFSVFDSSEKCESSSKRLLQLYPHYVLEV